MVSDICNCYFLLWAILPFYPPNSPQKIFLEMKKTTTGDIIILQMCTKNYD